LQEKVTSLQVESCVYKSSAVAEMGDRGHNRHAPKRGGGAAPFWGRRSWVPIQHNVARAESYLHAEFHLDPSSHLAVIHQRHKQTDRTDR